MKTIPVTFTANNDKTGNAVFAMVKQDTKTNTFIYKRTFDEPSYSTYEVFTAKTVKEGAPLPDGSTVKETYLQYPGSAAFGHTAFSINDLERANTKFNELIEKVNIRELDALETVDNEELVTSGIKGNRGRPAVTRPEIVYPQSKSFTIKQLLSVNPDWNQPTIHKKMQEFIKNNIVQVVGTQDNKGGKGKRATLYSVV